MMKENGLNGCSVPLKSIQISFDLLLGATSYRFLMPLAKILFVLENSKTASLFYTISYTNTSKTPPCSSWHLPASVDPSLPCLSPPCLIWPLAASVDPSLPYLTPHCLIWPLPALFDPSLPQLTPFCLIWPLAASVDPFLPYLTPLCLIGPLPSLLDTGLQTIRHTVFHYTIFLQRESPQSS